MEICQKSIDVYSQLKGRMFKSGMFKSDFCTILKNSKDITLSKAFQAAWVCPGKWFAGGQESAFHAMR